MYKLLTNSNRLAKKLMSTNKDDDWRAFIADAVKSLDDEDALGADGQSTVTLDQQSVGRLSRMDAIQQQAMAQATQARRNAMRIRLQAAVKRIDAGEFGYCEDCGDEIPEARLRLDPGVTRCISCASG
jgi:DnaK suppressor protein